MKMKIERTMKLSIDPRSARQLLIDRLNKESKDYEKNMQAYLDLTDEEILDEYIDDLYDDIYLQLWDYVQDDELKKVLYSDS